MTIRFSVLQPHRKLAGFNSIVKPLLFLAGIRAVRTQIVVELREPPGQFIVRRIVRLGLPKRYQSLSDLHQIRAASVELVRLGDGFGRWSCSTPVLRLS